MKEEKNRLKFSFDCPLKNDTENKKLHDSAQYDTARNLTLRSMILRQEGWDGPAAAAYRCDATKNPTTWAIWLSQRIETQFLVNGHEI